MSAPSVLGVMPGFVPLVEIEAILKDVTEGVVIRTEYRETATFTFATMTRRLSGFYERGDVADGKGPIVEDHTAISLGSDPEGIAIIREIVGYYGGFVMDNADIGDDWIELPATGKALPLTALDRYEIALIGTLSPEDARVLRNIAEVPHIRDSVRQISDEHFLEGSSPAP